MEVAEVEVGEVDVRRPRAGASVRGAEAVVRLPLLGIRQHVVRALDLLEARLGRRVAGVLVRVVPADELPVRLLDLVLRGRLRDLERLVQRLRHGYLSSRGNLPVPPGPPPLVRCRGQAASPPRPPLSPAAGRGRRAGSPSGAPGSRSPRPRPTAARGAPPACAGRTRRRSRSPAGPPWRAPPRASGGRGGRPPRAAPPRARSPR